MPSLASRHLPSDAIPPPLLPSPPKDDSEEDSDDEDDVSAGDDVLMQGRRRMVQRQQVRASAAGERVPRGRWRGAERGHRGRFQGRGGVNASAERWVALSTTALGVVRAVFGPTTVMAKSSFFVMRR